MLCCACILQAACNTIRITDSCTFTYILVQNDLHMYVTYPSPPLHTDTHTYRHTDTQNQTHTHARTHAHARTHTYTHNNNRWADRPIDSPKDPKENEQTDSEKGRVSVY